MGTKVASAEMGKWVAICRPGSDMLFSIRMKTLAVLISSALAVYAGLVNLSERISWGLPVDGIEWQQQNGVRVSIPETPEAKAALRPGDQLVSINRIPIGNFDDYTEILDLLAPQDKGQVVRTEYLMKRGQAEFVYTAGITLQSQVSASDYFLILTAFLYLLTGLFIYLRNGSAAGAFHFYLMCLVGFVLFVFRHTGKADALDIVVYWASAVALLLLPPLFLHFACYFPEPLPLMRRRPHLKPALYFPFALLLSVHMAWFAGQLSGFGLPRDFRIQLLLDRVHLLHFIAYFLAGALILVWMRRTADSVAHRQQMKWLTYGAVAGIVPFALLYGVPYLIGAPISMFMNASILGLALIPVSFGYAITRFRLMDVDVIVKRGAAYVIASSAILGVYLLLALLIGHAASRFSPDSGFVLFAIAALAGALFFAPVKNKIQEQLDKLFYREQYDYRRSLAEFGRTLASETDIDRLIDKICKRVERTLNLPCVALFVRDGAEPSTYRQYEPGSGRSVSLAVPDSIFSDFDRELNPVFFCPQNEVVEQVKRKLEGMGLHYVQPLRVHGRLLGFLSFGRRASGEPLPSEDLDLLASLAVYAGIAIDNAMLYQSLALKANELANLKQYNEQVIETLIAGVAVVTVDGQVTVWNASMERISGIDRQEAIGQNLSSLLPSPFLAALKSVMPGGNWAVSDTVRLQKTALVNRNAKTTLLNVSVTPFLLNEDVLTGTLMVLEDVTEKVRLEDQLMQAEKLSSIGLFAAGVAHEVNTPLAGISSYAQMLMKDFPEGHPQRELLQKIEKQSFRASNIVNSLLKFARVGNSEVQEVNINSLMLESLSLLDHQMRKANVEVDLELDASLPPTFANGGKLQQVFMNLFLNAKDAMPQGGHLTIKSYRRDSAVVVQVKDTGRGISDEDIKRIYDPFFTTKDVGQGTGLGLSITYGIIQEHSGQIDVQSQPGRGTTFTLQLPLRRVN